MVRKKSKLFISNVDGFNMIPLDILCEICNCLFPVDLLSLARTNKSIRNFILNRSNIAIWRAAFANNADAGGPPGCPSYLSEPAWTRVAFDKSCQVCEVALRDDIRHDSVWWEFGGRYCEDCLKQETCKRIPNELRQLVSGVAWDSVFPRIRQGEEYYSSGWYYVKAHQQELLARLSATDDDGLRRKIIAKRQAETARIMQHGKRCRSWAFKQIMNRADEDEKKAEAKADKAEMRRMERIHEIVKRMNDRGWNDEAWMKGGKLLDQLSSYPDILAAKRIATRSQESDDGLVARLSLDKRKFTLTSRLGIFERQRSGLSTINTAQLKIVPRPIDVALIPQVRTLLEGDRDLIELMEELRPTMPQLFKRWEIDALAQVTEHARNCLGLPNAPNPLELAIAIVPCPASCPQKHTYFDKLLQHYCPRLGSQWSNPVPHGTPTDTDSYQEVATSVYSQGPFHASVFRFQSGPVAEGLKNVVKAYGLSPESATFDDMKSQAAGRLLRCLSCDERFRSARRSRQSDISTAPKTWRDAVKHCAQVHYEDDEATEWELCD
ncbi:F-box domain-containing protein [Mycena indigotica]|uniref:F-box domain-containing protein n=1 Tax=Mycena indigotica TaxID=2126181 RepID=A0A8H6S9C7_9AGAR|nr:F-box domain-containing protein [Mycena indigotica]KAF7295371.1 F-box domain-containing protein [Mycena indigotica]